MKKPAPDPLFDFAAFLVVSARGSLEEGAYTASLRLIDAASRLTNLAPERRSGDYFLVELQTMIREGMTRNYLESEEKYVHFLDGLVERIAIEVRKRNGLPAMRIVGKKSRK